MQSVIDAYCHRCGVAPDKMCAVARCVVKRAGGASGLDFEAKALLLPGDHYRTPHFRMQYNNSFVNSIDRPRKRRCA